MQLENSVLDKYITFSDCLKLPRTDVGTVCPPPTPGHHQPVGEAKVMDWPSEEPWPWKCLKNLGGI